MSELRFDGRVAVVTGAGGGLGKAYALLLGSRGAKVVVNDLGGGRHGDGKSANLADAVVKEIKSKGGAAVADYNSVVEGEKIIKTALDNFGRVDIIINNAGILRDKSFSKISDQDWDLIQAVHVKGAFKTTQAAWELFKKQKFGRVIMTSSNAGLYGNFGQANYSAAKMGLVGLASTLAVEGAKYNIKVNVIVPTAASRLTEDILPPDLFQDMKPELIAPVVVYMCHESFAESGAIIDSAVGYAAKVHLVRGEGTHLRKKASEPVSLESVRDQWSKVADMSEAKHFDKIGDVTMALAQNLQDLKEQIDDGRNAVWAKFTYNSKDLIVYALGVGASVANTSDLRFLYESHESFAALPTFFVLPGMAPALESNLVASAMPPGKHADFTNLLHGEQYLELVGELPGTDGLLSTRSYVADVLDKGSSAVAIVNSDTYSGKELVFRNQQHVFVVGQGGWGGARTSQHAVPVRPAPARAPDAVAEQLTSVDQAALYRLSGDLNPLHIDPNMATASGYPRPILHGLSSLGFSSRHVLLRYGGNDPANFKALKVRFVKPVLPGQTLQTEMWLEGKRVFFQTKVKETGQTVIAGAYMDLNKIENGPSSATAASTPASSEPLSSAGDLKSDALFTKIQEEVRKQPAKAKSVGGVFLYNITENGKAIKQWTLDLKSAAVYEGGPKSGKADTTMSVSDADMVAIATGALNPQAAYLKGKLKITGNLMLAQKLGPFLKSDSKL